MKNLKNIFLKKRLYFILTVFVLGILILDIEECSSNMDGYAELDTKMQMQQQEVAKALDEVQKEMTTKGMFKSIHAKAKESDFIVDKGNYYEIGGDVRYPKTNITSMLMIADLLQMDNVLERAGTIFKGHYKHDLNKWKYDKNRKKYVIRYAFESSVNSRIRKVIQSCMRDWENGTRLQFIDITGQLFNFNTKFTIRVSNLDPGGAGGHVEHLFGLLDPYGMQNSLMVLAGELDSRVGKRVIRHEIGHVLGLPHEHQRWDRNDYVRLNWDIINKKGSEYVAQYQRLPKRKSSRKKHKFLWWTWYTTEWEGTDITLTDYDYNSVMNYRTYEAYGNKNYKETQMTKKGGAWINFEDVENVSQKDKDTINRIYD